MVHDLGPIQTLHQGVVPHGGLPCPSGNHFFSERDEYTGRSNQKAWRVFNLTKPRPKAKAKPKAKRMPRAKLAAKAKAKANAARDAPIVIDS